MAIDHSFKIYFVAAQSGCLFITVMQTFLFVKKKQCKGDFQPPRKSGFGSFPSKKIRIKICIQG